MYICACMLSAAFDWWSMSSMKGGVRMCVCEIVECIVNDGCRLFNPST